MKGDNFSSSNVIPLRPNLREGVPANRFSWILNKKSKRLIKKGECIKKDFIT